MSVKILGLASSFWVSFFSTVRIKTALSAYQHCLDDILGELEFDKQKQKEKKRGKRQQSDTRDMSPAAGNHITQ